MGLIPAHAGKTPKMGRGRRPAPAHPRSRGENPLRWPLRDFDQGSSPLTRGKRSGRARSRLAGRLIPAHAGKTHCSVLSVCRGAAHPRSRGENGARGGVRFGGGGSSPLTRGKLVGTRHVGPSTGLIPAHAGKTSYRRVGLRSFRAHPRSRGENAIARGARKRCGGSSPLTREKLKSAFGSVQSARLIPAHAGKTPFCSSVARAARAHPRSRGENAASASASHRVAGSSPLTRGKPQARRGGTRNQRLIPAHAGKTPYAAVRHWGPEAHPRSRGENAPSNVPSSSYSGSSPLTRGKRCTHHDTRGYLRLVPAHAGKTR